MTTPTLHLDFSFSFFPSFILHATHAGVYGRTLLHDTTRRPPGLLLSLSRPSVAVSLYLLLVRMHRDVNKPKYKKCNHTRTTSNRQKEAGYVRSWPYDIERHGSMGQAWKPFLTLMAMCSCTVQHLSLSEGVTVNVGLEPLT